MREDEGGGARNKAKGWMEAGVRTMEGRRGVKREKG